MKRKMLSMIMALAMILSLLPVTALAADEGTIYQPTASGTNFFANGTPITIEADKPENGQEVSFTGFTATRTSAYIRWNDGDTIKYVGVSDNVSVYGGADGSDSPVAIASTSITMTGGKVHNVYGGNLGKKANGAGSCSKVTGDVTMKFSGDAEVSNLLHGGGAFNTCVEGTVYMNFENATALNNYAGDVWPYINGGVYGNGSEGSRDTANGHMNTNAVVNRVEITATNSNLYLVGAGGSGSTKVLSGSVTLDNCTLTSLYLGGINGEVVDSSIVATGCTIKDLSATNRGFVGTANVDINSSTIDKLNFGACNGCFSTDSGTPDGSGITGSSVWNIDEATTVTAAQITPLVVRTGSSSNPTYATTYQNLTIQKAGTPISAAISDFSPVYTSGGTPSVTLNTFSVPEGSALKLSGVTATVAGKNTLTNVGTIDMDAASKLTVDTGATFGQLGTVNGTVDGVGTINDDYVARIGTTGYASLPDAVNAVTTTEPTTITLLKDTAGAGVVVNGTVQRNLTFDLGGHTYTITSGVGSAGTETNGFQLIKDNNITFKNGTIAANPSEGSQVKLLIQNYSNLTLENVTLDGTGLTDYNDRNYTLSNNNGEITLNSGTKIIPRTADDIAMDVCWAKYYQDGARVTVNEGAVIDGDVELGLWKQSAYEDNQSVLTVNGGAITGKLTLDQTVAPDKVDETIESLKTNITINGGSFGASVDAYVDSTDQASATVQSGTVYSYYASMEAAMAAAKPGDTITDLKATADNTVILTLNYSDDGATADSVYTVAKNTAVTLPQPTRDGYVFLGWYNADGNKVGSPYTVSKTETLTAQWSVISSGTSYAITVDKAENGTVTTSRTRASKGLSVTLTVKADEGYKLDTITVTDKNNSKVALTDKGDGKYTFTMPASAVTVKATFAKDDTPVETGLPFTDVKAGDWYYDAVKYVYDNDLMNGTSATTCSPFVTTSRAMILTILARYDGVDTSTGSTWYEAGAVWAIAEGVSDGTNLEANLTREQLVTMLWRYAGSPVVEGGLADYPDSASVSDWAVNAMIWAVENGVITGNGAGALNPQGTATRAEVATILMRFCENVAK